MITPASRPPVSLRISVTDRCQLRCRYCVPPGGVAKLPREDILSYEEIVRFVRVLRTYAEISKIHITGGDPLVRPGMVDLFRMLKDEGAVDLALTTNGQRLAEWARELHDEGLRRVNVSLDSLNPRAFREITRGGELQRTIDGIETVIELGFSPVKLNMVVMRNVNDSEIIDIARFGLERCCQVRFLELMPVGPAASSFEELSVSTSEVRGRLADGFDLQCLTEQNGGSSRSVLARAQDGLEGTLGFISPYTDSFCGGCRRLRLTATGRLVGCLALGKGPSIRDLLRENDPSNESRLMHAISETLRLKKKPNAPGTRKQPNAFSGRDSMVAIGG